MRQYHDLLKRILTDGAAYGELKFKVLLHEGIREWDRVITDVAAKNSLDPRAGARSFMLRTLVDQSHTQGDTAAIMTAAIAWLAAKSPVGPLFSGGESPPAVHYEITDITDNTGRHGQNFRLDIGAAAISAAAISAAADTCAGAEAGAAAVFARRPQSSGYSTQERTQVKRDYQRQY